ncbi:MAG: hemerythrin domain-containing protein [Phycisphaerales bacterium]|nr:hemerythrin domain-containing protein [Phycisphaerales bacterium]
MSNSEHPPLTREQVLAPFSRDHYTGLVQSSRLRKAPPDGAEACAKLATDFIDAWDREIADHFDDEERLLLELMNDPDRQRLLNEHGQVRDLAARIRAERDRGRSESVTLRAMGDLLESHIRWEERDLFNRLQQALTDEQRRALEAQTAVIDPARGRKPRHTRD